MRAKLLSLLPVVLTAACGGDRPSNLGVYDGKLTACPSTPNCVSSDSPDSAHHVPPFSLAADAPDMAWAAVREVVDELPRTTVVTEMENYLHVECASRLFRFVDDLELHLRPSDGHIAVRSASRIGRGDLGVNRRRVERLRSTLRERGVVE